MFTDFTALKLDFRKVPLHARRQQHCSRHTNKIYFFVLNPIQLINGQSRRKQDIIEKVLLSITPRDRLLLNLVLLTTLENGGDEEPSI